MKQLRIIGLLLFFQCIFVQSLYAGENNSFDAFPRAGVGLSKLSYVQSDGTKLDANYATLDLGLTVKYGQFYVDMLGELFGSDFLEKEGEITSIERQDFTVTAGFMPVPSVSLFVGYTDGEMKDDFQGEFHEDRGPFIGAGYSYLHNETSLAFNLAYAGLDGTVTVDEEPEENTAGETTGFSYGFTVSGPFRETMGYKISLKVRQYDYEVDDTNEVTDKRITSLNLGLIF